MVVTVDFDNLRVPKRDFAAEQRHQEQFLKLVEEHPELAEFCQTGGTAFGLFAFALMATNGLTTF